MDGNAAFGGFCVALHLPRRSPSGMPCEPPPAQTALHGPRMSGRKQPPNEARRVHAR